METIDRSSITATTFKKLPLEAAGTFIEELREGVIKAIVSFFRSASEGDIDTLQKVKVAVRDGYLTNLTKGLKLLNHGNLKTELAYHTKSGEPMTFGKIGDGVTEQIEALNRIVVAALENQPMSKKDISHFAITQRDGDSPARHERVMAVVEKGANANALLVQLMVNRNVVDQAALCADNMRLFKEIDDFGRKDHFMLGDLHKTIDKNLPAILENLEKLKVIRPEIQVKEINPDNKLTDCDYNNSRYASDAIERMFNEKAPTLEKLEQKREALRPVKLDLALLGSIVGQYNYLLTAYQQMEKDETRKQGKPVQTAKHNEPAHKKTFSISDNGYSIPSLPLVDTSAAKAIAQTNIRGLEERTDITDLKSRAHYNGIKVMSPAIKAFDFDKSSVWQVELANEMLSNKNVHAITHAFTPTSEMAKAGALPEFDANDRMVRSGLSSMLSDILKKKSNGKGKEACCTSLDMLSLIDQHQDALLSGIANNSLKDTISRIPSFGKLLSEKPEYSEQLNNMSFEQLQQNVNLFKGLKNSSAVLAIFAFGDESDKAKATQHFMKRTIQKPDDKDAVGTNTFSAIFQDMLDARKRMA